MTLNVRKGEARVTASLPGTGLSYVERHRLQRAQAQPPESYASRQVTSSMVAYARSVKDGELRQNLKEALITANAAKEKVAHLSSDDRETALWEADIFRSELERRKADSEFTPEPFDDEAQQAAYQRARDLDARQTSPSKVAQAKRGHPLLLAMLFGFIAGVRRGMRR